MDYGSEMELIVESCKLSKEARAETAARCKYEVTKLEEDGALASMLPSTTRTLGRRPSGG